MLEWSGLLELSERLKRIWFDLADLIETAERIEIAEQNKRSAGATILSLVPSNSVLCKLEQKGDILIAEPIDEDV